jgi:predicted MFS family arabinose efflux permease
MIRTDSLRGRIALMVAHCAGMVDLVALPVWVGTLMAQYHFDPQQAGGLVTLFLLSAVLASSVMAPRFHRLQGRWVAVPGFALAALAFLAAARMTDFASLAGLHVLSGLGAGAALSVTHGTIGRSASPHRLFAIVGTALGLFAVIFLGATPALVAALGGPALFMALGGVMAVAALVAAMAFPVAEAESVASQAFRVSGQRLSRAVWCVILGVSSMAVVQAMVFSFVERAGAERGFSAAQVTAVLIAVGLVNLLPTALAALLERRLDARRVVLAGPAVQAALALAIAGAAGFWPYALATAVFVTPMLFTHTFAFGLLARLDVSGRATAATPAMLMIGSAIGPVLGGTLVKAFGYGGLGLVALLIDGLAIFLFSRVMPAAAPVEAAA